MPKDYILTTESFLAFYPSRPCWMISKIDFKKHDFTKVDSISIFTDLMSEFVYEKSNDDFIFKVCRDGMILIHIKALESNVDGDVDFETTMKRNQYKWGNYLNFLNTYYLFLDSSLLKLHKLNLFDIGEITNKDAFTIRFNDGSFVSSSIAHESITSVFQMGRYLVNYNTPFGVEYDSNISSRQIIPKNVIEESVSLFKSVVKSPRLLKIFASLTKSMGEYKVGNYETSIILAWFISEKILNEIWLDYLNSLDNNASNGVKRINKDRREHCLSYDISPIINILELLNCLDFDLYKDINKVRTFRNKIAHGNPKFFPSTEDAELSINVAVKLINKLYKIELVPNLSYGLPSI